MTTVEQDDVKQQTVEEMSGVGATANIVCRKATVSILCILSIRPSVCARECVYGAYVRRPTCVRAS